MQTKEIDIHKSFIHFHNIARYFKQFYLIVDNSYYYILLDLYDNFFLDISIKYIFITFISYNHFFASIPKTSIFLFSCIFPHVHFYFVTFLLSALFDFSSFFFFGLEVAMEENINQRKLINFKFSYSLIKSNLERNLNGSHRND